MKITLRQLFLATTLCAIAAAFVAFVGLDAIGGILLIWLIHAMIAVTMSAPIVFFGRKRVQWQPWESLVLILPFMVWTVLMLSQLSVGRKSLSNLAEPIYFAVAVPLAALVRVAFGSKLPEQACAAGLIAANCVVAAGVFFLVPSLPE